MRRFGKIDGCAGHAGIVAFVGHAKLDHRGLLPVDLRPAVLRKLTFELAIFVDEHLEASVRNRIPAKRDRPPVMYSDFEMNEREQATEMTADGVAAVPNRAAARAGT